ncbi:PREDICTED: uncharacterized protein LOC105558124 [Vollenhovia emeryi]|uniref:uncharacterized protein LOC105558124 n=1 Tax=Vollenhovia emeryi TaxID=411798 RepID=UPI0005F4115C|nr:PREDICTED: uncharacterized protein LOC105558124 [Vollenhovia emeryi]
MRHCRVREKERKEETAKELESYEAYVHYVVLYNFCADTPIDRIEESGDTRPLSGEECETYAHDLQDSCTPSRRETQNRISYGSADEAYHRKDTAKVIISRELHHGIVSLCKIRFDETKMAYKWRFAVSDIKRQLAANNRVCDRGYDDSTINHEDHYQSAFHSVERGVQQRKRQGALFFTFFISLRAFIFNSVHFKIHVPEIIKHQIHTKTVFIHIHKPDISTAPKKSKPKEEAPKKKKTYHKESHHENWSSWSNYGYHDDKSDNDVPKNQKDHKDDDVHKEMAHKDNPFAQYHRDSYMPVLQHDDKSDHSKGRHGDTMGYSYPPQYAVTEDVKEIDNNDIGPYMHTYEEGYHKGGESANGHIYSGDVTKFYDDKHEEGDHSVEEYKNESKEKTHAGRYFVDDSEFQHNNKAEKRVPSRIRTRS